MCNEENVRGALVACAVALAIVGCDRAETETPEPPPAREVVATDAPPKEAVKVPVKAPQGVSKRTFHAGRLSIEVDGAPVGAPKLTEKKETRDSSQTWSSLGEVVSVTVNESLVDGALNGFGPGAVKFMEGRQRKNVTEVLEEGEIELPDLKTSARHFYGKRKNGKRSHTALLTPDPYTMLMVVALEREPMTTEEFTTILRSIRIEKTQERAADTVEEVTPEQLDSFYEDAAARGAESAEDVKNLPTSTKPGAPSVANSCNLMTLQCYETAHSGVGAGYYSTPKKCMGSFAEAMPCPSEKRVAFCQLNPEQLISFYESEHSSLEERKATCEGTYKGKWLGLPKKRPWPRNAKK